MESILDTFFGPFLPERAATTAHQVDYVFVALNILSGFLILLLIVLIVGFSLRYRAGSRADRSNKIKKTWKWELTWISIASVLSLLVFVWPAFVFVRIQRPPADAHPIYVTGKQWMWKIQHPGGPQEINELHLAVGEPVRLLMRSQDVIHSFYIPAFRVKQDVLPGRYTTLWFRPDRVGRYHLFCAEYCGTDHSLMRGQVVVMKPADYEKWYQTASAEQEIFDSPRTPVLAGKEQANVFYRYGCNACHTPDSMILAPRLDGLYGGETKLSNGKIIIADEQYIRESVYQPNAKIVAGYPQPSLMPTYKGLIDEEEMLELIEFIKSIEHGWPVEQRTP